MMYLKQASVCGSSVAARAPVKSRVLLASGSKSPGKGVLRAENPLPRKAKEGERLPKKPESLLERASLS